MARFIVTSLLVFFGCEQSSELPDDFELTITMIPSQPGAGGAQRISIARDTNKSEYFVTIVSENVTRNAVALSQIQDLYRTIVSDRIFHLKSRYEDVGVLDGGTTSVHVKANGKEKSIQLRNITPKELSGFFSKVNAVITAK